MYFDWKYSEIHWYRKVIVSEKIQHADVIKWKYFPRYCPLTNGIHRSRVHSPLKGQWREALIYSLICTWTNGWANNRDAGDLERHRPHDDANVMKISKTQMRLPRIFQNDAFVMTYCLASHILNSWELDRVGIAAMNMNQGVRYTLSKIKVVVRILSIQQKSVIWSYITDAVVHFTRVR